MSLENELQLNNYLFDRLNKQFFNVQFSDLIELQNGNIDFYEPIKLTEKSILKLDFCKDNTENNKTYISPIHNGVVMKIYFNRFGVAKLFIGNNMEIEIPYVHTLQNAYSLLTSGGELVFSTEP